MTMEELKTELAKLPPHDRFALADWIEQDEDVRVWQREELLREIRVGLDQADRGELIEADAVFAEFATPDEATGR